MEELTQQQINFCRYYFETSDPTGSAIRAGYSKRSATQIASRLLTKDNIKNYLHQLNQPIAEKLGITVESVLREIANIAFNPQTKDYVKLKALGQLGDHLQIWDTKPTVVVNTNHFENMTDDELKQFIESNYNNIKKD